MTKDYEEKLPLLLELLALVVILEQKLKNVDLMKY